MPFRLQQWRRQLLGKRRARTVPAAASFAAGQPTPRYQEEKSPTPVQTCPQRLAGLLRGAVDGAQHGRWRGRRVRSVLAWAIVHLRRCSYGGRVRGAVVHDHKVAPGVTPSNFLPDVGDADLETRMGVLAFAIAYPVLTSGRC